MSNVLDELVMEDVSLHCPAEFIDYHRCISSIDPNKDCSKLQINLSNCIKTKVPSIKKILANCNDKMMNYQDCIIKNTESRTINENCLGLLEDLRECAKKQVENDKLPINEMKLRQVENSKIKK